MVYFVFCTCLCGKSGLFFLALAYLRLFGFVSFDLIYMLCCRHVVGCICVCDTLSVSVVEWCGVSEHSVLSLSRITVRLLCYILLGPF